MPKQKTNRSALKRFKVTKNRKVRRNKPGSRPSRSGLSPKRKRNSRRPGLVCKAERLNYLRLLGWG